MSGRQSDRPILYTAGAMKWRNEEDSTWRRSVDVDVPNAQFLHPDTDAWFDHGGDLVTSCVSEDIELLGRSDGVVAYFTKPDQVGTITELLHAVMTGKPALVMYAPEMGDPFGMLSSEEPPEYPARQGMVHMRAESDEYWFLINYLSGDTNVDGQRTVPNIIPKWDGQPNVEQWVVEDGDIPSVVAQWVSDTFGTDMPEWLEDQIGLGEFMGAGSE